MLRTGEGKLRPHYYHTEYFLLSSLFNYRHELPLYYTGSLHEKLSPRDKSAVESWEDKLNVLESMLFIQKPQAKFQHHMVPLSIAGCGLKPKPTNQKKKKNKHHTHTPNPTELEEQVLYLTTLTFIRNTNKNF